MIRKAAHLTNGLWVKSHLPSTSSQELSTAPWTGVTIITGRYSRVLLSGIHMKVLDARLELAGMTNGYRTLIRAALS